MTTGWTARVPPLNEGAVGWVVMAIWVAAPAEMGCVTVASL